MVETLNSPRAVKRLWTSDPAIPDNSAEQMHPIQKHSAASNGGGHSRFSQCDLMSSDYLEPRDVITNFQHTDRSQQNSHPSSSTHQINCMEQGKQPLVKRSIAQRFRNKYRRSNESPSDFEKNEIHHCEDVNDLYFLSRSQVVGERAGQRLEQKRQVPNPSDENRESHVSLDVAD